MRQWRRAVVLESSTWRRGEDDRCRPRPEPQGFEAETNDETCFLVDETNDALGARLMLDLGGFYVQYGTFAEDE